MLRRRLAAAIAVPVLLMPVPANADKDASVACSKGRTRDTVSGQCTLDAAVAVAVLAGQGAPKSPPASDKPAGQQPAAVAPSCARKSPTPGEVPCAGPFGYWSNDRQCYVRAASPQPPLSDPTWAGHTDGAIYTCSFDVGRNGPNTASNYVFWSATQPAGPAAAPDPAEVARHATSQMRLHAVAMGMTPENRPGAVAIVGLPVWLWVAEPSPQTFGPQVKSLTESGVTVTATARVTSVVWEMGDGGAVTCQAGTPWTVEQAGESSPDCGYTYSAQGTVTVRATSHWTVTWQSNTGRSGVIPLQFTAQRVMDVAEVQVVRKS